MTTEAAIMNDLKLRTGHVFANAADPLGELWAKMSDLEDQVGEQLMRMPAGTVVSSGGVGWQLMPSGEEDMVELVGGQLEDGKLQDPMSRFDIGLDWVDVDEAALLYQIDGLSDVLAQLEARPA